MQNHVTVIPDDSVIAVDGHTLIFNYPFPPALHALQWHNGTGHIEYNDGRPNRALAAADYATEAAPFVALWQAEKDRLEEEANRPPTPEEQAARETAAATAASGAILTSRMQRQLVQVEAFTPVEFATFAKAGLFEAWAAGQTYAKSARFVHEGVVYEAQQDVTAQTHQAPGSTGMLAVYRPLSVDAGTGAEPDGSREHPYSFIHGMDVYNGKYYTFEDKLYLAKADMKPCTWSPGTPGLWQWEVVV